VAAACLVFLLQSVASPYQRKKKKDPDFTQTLEVLPDPPLSISAETARLSYLTTPLSPKGLLSQQTRDALKSLFSLNRGAQVIRLRAFVAGTGDLRRVQSIVSEVFTERKLSLPVLTTVQVGALPMEGAQVQIEATLQDRKPSNPLGVAFLAGQDAADPKPGMPVPPLATQSAARLQTALTAIGSTPDDVLRVSCFLSSLDNFDQSRAAVTAVFPRAQLLFAQTQRSPDRTVVECEAVARLRKAPASPVQFLNPPGLPASPNYSHIALVSAPRLIFTGAQLAFRYEEADARLAFQRLEKTLQAAGATLKNTIFLGIFPLSPQLAAQVRKVRGEFVEMSHPPASTMLPFEGLPSMDASFGLEVIALPNSSSP
jgi:enamine deaminase RidA (YjgF/YER057c/UK114 family)